MKQEEIDRINFLARKSRTQALSDEEKAEQKLLRQKYIEGFRRSLKSQLDNIEIVDKK